MMSMQLNILTLNIWGIPYVSSDREERVAAISAELCTGQYDIVSLQEVWSQADVQTLKDSTAAVLPYAHYFYSGVIGAGLLVLSKYPIVGTLFHAWSVNGYFHRIQHADWFGGKGVGLCRIRVGSSTVHLYNAHLHAEYDNDNDEYKTHRVIQAFDTAQFIEATRGSSALQILAGDLNTKPHDITYNVLLQMSKMRDCCRSETLATNECKSNSYTSKAAIARNPDGIRIDHIFVRSADDMQVTVVEHTLPLPDRVPGHKFSYSDHEAVLTRFKCTTRGGDGDGDGGSGSGSSSSCSSDTANVNEDMNSCPASVAPPAQCDEALPHGDHTLARLDGVQLHANGKEVADERSRLLNEAIALCDRSLQELKGDRILYYSVALVLTVVIVVLAEIAAPSGFKTVFLLLKLFVFVLMLFSLFMGSLWNFMERNGILSGKMAMEIALRNLDTPSPTAHAN